MAAFLAGTATGPGAVDNMFVQLDTLLLANGWTQWKVISSTTGARDVVYLGTALDATAGNAPFIRLTQTSSVLFTLRAYSDWDQTAITGINEAGSTSTSHSTATLSDATFGFYARVNGQSLALVYKVGANIYRHYAGFLRRGCSSARAGMTKTTQAYAVGASSMNVASDMTAKLKVGQKVMIMNYAHNNGSANKSNAEVVQISSITSSSISFSSSTTKAYDSGAIIGENVYPLCVTNAPSGVSAPQFYLPLNLDGSYVSASGNTASTSFSTLSPIEANNDPHDVNQTYTAAPITVSASVAGKTGFCGIMHHMITVEGGNQLTEDIMDDGVNTYLVAGISGTVGVCIGPRE